MFGNLGNCESDRSESKPKDGARRWSLSRRSLIGAAAIAGLAASARPAERAFAWSSWTNATSGMLKKIGMGDCVHEDLVQISYARVVRKYKGESTSQSLLNPWGGVIKEGDAQHATIAGDTVYAGEGKTFENADQLAKLLYRENLAYLRIGSFWNDAAANQLKDFAYSCGRSNCVPKFSGPGGDYYEGAWDVGKHIRETHTTNQGSITTRGLDALVQFTMNDRNNFIHGMLTSQADLSRHLSQAEVKRYALQWLGVAYEFARTGDIDNLKTSDVTNEQAKQIFNGFIDTYGQLAGENDTEEDKHGMCVSLQVSSSEASITLPKRRLRLRALGMMCHTLEDFWCPAHTCRTYHEGGSVKKNSILAFSNYKLQNGNKAPMFGYHIPFDRYAVSDVKNSTNWREAFTRGQGQLEGTERLDKAISPSMNDIEDAHTLFNTLGMNESIECITKLFDFMYQGIAWDDGVRTWVDEEVMPTYFNGDESYICDAGRRSLHTPTYLIAPIELMKRAYRKAGMSDNYKAILKAAKDYDAWQRGAHLFHSGECNTNKSKTIPSGYESKSIWSEETGEERLLELVNKLHEGYSTLNSDASKKRDLLARIGCNGCHAMSIALFRVGGMLQDFNIELRGKLRPNGTDNRDEIMQKIFDLRAFFESGLQLGLQAQGEGEDAQSSPALGLFAAGVAYADEGASSFATSNMVLEDLVDFEDGSYLIAVRNMDSLATSIMQVPKNTPGKDKLEEGDANLKISYTLQTEFEGDPDFRYVVTEIDRADVEEGVYLVTGTVKSVAADKKSFVLDMNGTGDFEMDIRAGADVPQAGEYICVRYSFGDEGLELVGYDELDKPAKQEKVEYPVAKVVGSRLWLLVNEINSEDEEGDVNYLQVEYRSADVRWIPQEGCMATVIYHDEAYGSVTDVDEAALIAASHEGASNEGTSGGGDFEDSVGQAGYLDFGDDYGALNYGNEVFHIADVIVGSSTKASKDDLNLMFGAYYEEKSPIAQTTEYRYFKNNDGTHRKYTADLSRCTEENCKYDSAGKCTLCGYVKPSPGGQTPGQNTKPKLKAQTIKVNKTAKRVRAARLKKKPRFTTKVKVTGAKTKVTYKRLKKGSSPKLPSINPRTGKIKVKRGTPKGTYRIRIKVTAAKTAKYRAASKIATIKVNVI